MPNSGVLEITRTCEGSLQLVEKPKRSGSTKADKLLKLLRSKRGATIEQLQEASGWQAHSVRGFLSGTVKKRMGLAVESEPDKDGVRRYRIIPADQVAAGQ